MDRCGSRNPFASSSWYIASASEALIWFDRNVAFATWEATLDFLANARASLAFFTSASPRTAPAWARSNAALLFFICGSHRFPILFSASFASNDLFWASSMISLHCEMPCKNVASRSLVAALFTSGAPILPPVLPPPVLLPPLAATAFVAAAAASASSALAAASVFHRFPLLVSQ